jgi:hypothetical protein
MLIKTDLNEKVMNRCSLFDLIVIVLSILGAATFFTDWVVILNIGTTEVLVLTGYDTLVALMTYGSILPNEYYLPTVCLAASVVILVMSGIKGVSETIGYGKYRIIMFVLGVAMMAAAGTFLLWTGVYESFSNLALFSGFGTWTCLILGMVTGLYGVYSRPRPRGDVEWTMVTS